MNDSKQRKWRNVSTQSFFLESRGVESDHRFKDRRVGGAHYSGVCGHVVQYGRSGEDLRRKIGMHNYILDIVKIRESRTSASNFIQ